MALEETAGFTVLVHLPEPRVDYHETVGGKEVMQWTPTHEEKLAAGRQGNSFLSVKGEVELWGWFEKVWNRSKNSPGISQIYMCACTLTLCEDLCAGLCVSVNAIA